MSLLDLYSKGSFTGVAGPSAKRQKQLEDGMSNLKPENAGAFGDTYADATLAAARTGKNSLTSRTTIVAQQPLSRYTTKIFEQVNAGSNELVNRANTSNNYGPGRFATDIVSYTDRQFMIQNASLGQAAINPSVLAVATQTVPILTAVSSTIGTTAGEPFDDGRYIATIGYDYVLYTTRGTYG